MRATEVVKGLKPTCTIFFEHVTFEEGSVKCVCIVNEFLEAGEECCKFLRRQ
jgi:hypothetical protein